MAHKSNTIPAHKRSFDDALLDGHRLSGEVRIPVTNSLIPGILPYFEEYGEVENIFVSIRFKDQIVADSVLRKRFHKVGNVICMVDESPKISNAKKIKLDEPPFVHILDLNDDTLMKIFKHLNFIDLAHISETCIRLDNVAKKVFMLNSDKWYLGKYPYTTLNINRLSMSEADVVLPRFGDSIKQLEMNGWLDKDEDNCEIVENCLDTVTKYCKNLRSFFLRYKIFRMNELKKVLGFSKLNHLQLEIDTFEHNGDISDFPITSNPKIQELHIEYGYISNLSAIITLMPNLRQLYCVDPLANGTLFESNLQRLGQLKALKCLKIGCSLNELPLVDLCDGLSSGGVMIEDITIIADKIAESTDDIISSITKLKTIKSLNLVFTGDDCVLEDHHLVRIGKALPLLSQLDIGSIDMTIGGLKEMLLFANRLTKINLTPECYPRLVLSTTDYRAMVNTVKRRPNKLKLSLHLDVNYDQIGADVRERDSDWLKLI